MATSLLLTFILLLSSAFQSQSTLTKDFYLKSCPKFEQIVQDTITDKQIKSPTTAAGTLRLFLHDCLLNGCDGSILVTSSAFNIAERDADINLSLPGDAFDVVVRAKTALELTCSNTVSCADILSVATRDLVVMVGGPYYDVLLGRRDSQVSKASTVEGNLPRPTMSMSEIIKIFESRGFTIQEMVALSGAHTIGFSHCTEFVSKVKNNPHYNARFAEGLEEACLNSTKNPTVSVFNDIMTPNKFDNAYFQNLPKGLGVLESDHGLAMDSRTKPYVKAYADDEDKFFKEFAAAMQKLSNFRVQTGTSGEIRHRCDSFN